MNNDIHFFEVGGCVRDSLLGRNTKDIDFTVVAPSFGAMRQHLLNEGFTIHVENPEFQTIRCGVPEGHVLRKRTKDADFVWARHEGPYSDGRHPDWVEPGTLLDDLERRDFTVNAIARGVDGHIIDPFNGKDDLENGVLRFVGSAQERIAEDALRVLRGIRFMTTHGLQPDLQTFFDLCSEQAAEGLAKVSIERVREELERMLAFDTRKSLRTVFAVIQQNPAMEDAIFRDGLRLSATLAK